MVAPGSDTLPFDNSRLETVAGGNWFQRGAACPTWNGLLDLVAFLRAPIAWLIYK